MKIELAVEALQEKIKRMAMYSPIPNNFFYEKIMYLNQWDNVMLDYILACTYFMGKDRMKYSANLVKEEKDKGNLLGLPRKPELQRECIDRLAVLGLIKRSRKRGAADIIELNFYTFWVKEMADSGYQPIPTRDKLEGYAKNQPIPTGDKSYPHRGQVKPKPIPTGDTNIREREIATTGDKVVGIENSQRAYVFEKDLESMEEDELDKRIEAADLRLSEAIKNSNDQNLFGTPLTDAMIDESNTPQKRVADFLLLKRKTFMDDPKHDLTKWAKDIELAIRIDKRTEDQLMRIIRWIYSDAGKFWKPHIQSGTGLRKKFETMEGQRKNSSPNKRKQRRPV